MKSDPDDPNHAGDNTFAIDEITPQDLRNRVEFLRARKFMGLSQGQLAKALGLAQRNVVQRYEIGTREISGPIARLVWMFLKYGIPKGFVPKD